MSVYPFPELITSTVISPQHPNDPSHKKYPWLFNDYQGMKRCLGSYRRATTRAWLSSFCKFRTTFSFRHACGMRPITSIASLMRFLLSISRAKM
jgi:hypothetical protein